MNKRIVYTQSNGIVAIIIPAPNTKLTLDQIAKRSVPKGVSYWIINASEIPKNREDRNAWELVNMPKPDGVGQ